MNINSLEIVNTIYPVGSVYISMNATNPSNLFGGTWEQLKDRFLLGVGDTYKTVNATGGEATHELTMNELPSHSHTFSGTTAANGKHSHSVGASTTATKGSNQNRVSSINTSDTSYGTSQVAAHTHTFEGETDWVGMDWGHNNMPPYLTVYMWKRTA